MTLFEELQGLMIKYHFRPDKKMSQFFCTNEALLQFLAIEAKISKKDVVLEIGPGTGFLTKRLLEKGKVVAIEKDEIMYDLLSAEFADDIASGKLRLFFGDALEKDFDALGVNKIVCLPPYHISSKILAKACLSKNIEKALIVFDSGFVEKIVAFEGFTEYGSLTAFLNLNAKAQVLEKIEASSFFPAPNCVSEVVQIDFKRKNDTIEYFTYLKELFRHKNKDLHRALSQALPFLISEIGWKASYEPTFKKLKLTGKKVYALSPQELLAVYEEVNGTKKAPLEKTVKKKTVSKKAKK